MSKFAYILGTYLIFSSSLMALKDDEEISSKNPTQSTKLEKEEQQDLQSLPIEIFCNIAGCLHTSEDYQDIINLAVTCKRLYEGINEPYWQAQFGMLRAYLRVFMVENAEKPKYKTWRKFYESFQWFGTKQWCLDFLGRNGLFRGIRTILFKNTTELLPNPSRIDLLNVAFMAGKVSLSNQHDSSPITEAFKKFPEESRAQILNLTIAHHNSLQHLLCKIGGGLGYPKYWGDDLTKIGNISMPLARELTRSAHMIWKHKIETPLNPHYYFNTLKEDLDKLNCSEEYKLHHLIQGRHILNLCIYGHKSIDACDLFLQSIKSDLVKFDEGNFPNQDEIQKLATKLLDDHLQEKARRDMLRKNYIRDRDKYGISIRYH